MTHAVAEVLAATRWKFADQDPRSRDELKSRLIATAKSQGEAALITYSNLVAGVHFHVGTVNDGNPFEIDTHNWSELHRAILGDFLGHIASESYCQHGFLLSAVAVDAIERRPSKPFFKWVRTLGLLRDRSEAGELAFWSDQVRWVQEHYKRT